MLTSHTKTKHVKTRVNVNYECIKEKYDDGHYVKYNV